MLSELSRHLICCPCVQVYDFPTLIAYTNYSTCVSQQPGRLVSQAYEVWKVSDVGTCVRIHAPGSQSIK